MNLGPALTRREVVSWGLAACAAGLAGCGGPDSGHPSLTLWTLALSPYFDDFIRGQISAFEYLHPGLTVRWVDIPYDALERKLVTAAAAGRAPDVVNTPDLSFARFARAGAFADLTPLLSEQERGRYLRGAIAMCSIGGSLLGLPWYVNPQSLIVNTELLARGGLSESTLPRTWRAMLAAAPEFKARTDAFLFSQPLGEESQLPIMLLAEGLPIVTDRGGRLRAGLLDPAVLEYLALWQVAFASGSLPRDAATRGHAHLADLYQNSRLAAINTGPNFVKRIRDVAPAVYAATRVLPGAVGALGRVHMPVMAMSVLASSPRPGPAAELAAFLTGPESQLLLCREAAVMPSTEATLDDPFFTTPPRDTLESARTVAAATVRDAVAFTPALGCWPAMRRSFEERFKAVLLEGVPLERAMEAASREWDGLLADEAGATLAAMPRVTGGGE
ncbi:MAG: extracellular solute-binding protein [Phycisphaerales bacterium]